MWGCYHVFFIGRRKEFADKRSLSKQKKIENFKIITISSIPYGLIITYLIILNLY